MSNNIIENNYLSHTPDCYIYLEKLFLSDIIQVCDNKHFFKNVINI
jgi:hypothetical protein